MATGIATGIVTSAWSTGSGKPAWRALFDGAAGGGDYPYDIAITPDGARVVIDAIGSAAGPLDFIETIAYEA